MRFLTCLLLCVGFLDATVISPCDVGRNGFVIRKPGVYELCKDVGYLPNGNSPAIRITVDNVTLDLNGFTLSQKNGNFGVDGIVVDPGLTNIVIKNGTVRDFQESGIRVGAIGGEVVSEVIVSDLRALDNAFQYQQAGQLADVAAGAGGLVILNAQDVTIENSDLNENAFSGFWGINVLKLDVEDSHFDDNVWGYTSAPNFPEAFAFSLIGSGGTVRDITLFKSTFNRTQSIGLSTGINLATTGNTSILNVAIESCEANDTQATISDPAVASALFNVAPAQAVGMDINNVADLVIDKCQVNASSLRVNTPLTPSFPSNIFDFNKVSGISLATSGGVSITNCMSNAHTFQNNSGVGLRVGTQSITCFGVGPLYIANCQTVGNFNLAPTSGPEQPLPSLLLVEGIDLSIVGDVLVEDCFSSEHSQSAISPFLSQAMYSYAAGFSVHLKEFGSVTFRRCIATNNTDGTPSTITNGGLAYGFTTREPQTPGDVNGPIVFEGCQAMQNTNPGATGAGFDLFDAANSQIIHCFADKNNAGILVGESASGNTTNNMISSNYLLANTTFGILEGTTGTFNAYFSNKAKNNGPTPLTTNYSGPSFPTTFLTCPLVCIPPGADRAPVRHWLLPHAPCPLNSNCELGSELDNLSIVN